MNVKTEESSKTAFRFNRVTISCSYVQRVLLGCLILGQFPLLAFAETNPMTWESNTVNESVLLKEMPHVRQKPDFCGEACVAMYLNKLGYRVDQDFVFDQSKLSPALGRGCYTRELKTALDNIGFSPGKVWHQIDVAESNAEMNKLFSDLYINLKAGVPSIVCTYFDDRPNTTEHFRLIVGYDAKEDLVIYHDPALDDGKFLKMSRAKFYKLWPLRYSDKKHTVIYMPLTKNRIVAKMTDGFTDADFAQHIMELKKKIPSDKFHVVIQKPFVVIGDESLSTVKRRATGTVKWSIDRLKKSYFSKDPDKIIDIWLFKDKESYETNCWKIYKTKPTTPFGFYTATHNALIMNISTGGGTLVHEIVHPFMAANFPACPSWFNEGLASLYEQCRDKNGNIYGSTNWRLRGLQIAVKDDRVPSFKTLCSTTTREFYNEDPGTNYAQGRYLCYYLQEKGLLRKYYHDFVKNAKTDPTGLETLKLTLGVRDMAKFKKEWEVFVSKLRF